MSISEVDDRRAQLRRSNRRVVPLLELHVTHACNLACESCSHYSNHPHKGHLDLEEADRWMRLWRPRLKVRTFHLLGGEPTVHPKLAAFIPLVRKHWPKAKIGILTNGFFLHRHPNLPGEMAATNRTFIRLSIHHDSPEYRQKLQPVFDLLQRWQAEHGIVVRTRRSFENWTRRYEGYGADMLPFADNDQRRSWEICPAKYCKQLFQGKLWKCAPLAYLQLQSQKYRLTGKWDTYLKYKPLRPDCTDEELDHFLAIEDEAECSMCPAKRRQFELPIPLRNLTALAATA
jgi:hypothetical protein